MQREQKFMQKNENEMQQKIDHRLSEVVELSLLYDFYGELLDDHKKQIFEDYVLNDLSLREIAEEAGISRQGVHDIVKRCSIRLKEYEDKLCLIKKFEQTKKMVSDILQISKDLQKSQSFNEIKKIEQLSEEILKIY